VHTISLEVGMASTKKSGGKKSSRAGSTKSRRSSSSPAGSTKSRRGSSSRKARQQVRTEMQDARSGKRRVKSRKQAVAIGLNKAPRKGAKIPKPGKARGRRAK
jgi:hypothetical protein